MTVSETEIRPSVRKITLLGWCDCCFRDPLFRTGVKCELLFGSLSGLSAFWSVRLRATWSAMGCGNLDLRSLGALSRWSAPVWGASWSFWRSCHGAIVAAPPAHEWLHGLETEGQSTVHHHGDHSRRRVLVSRTRVLNGCLSTSRARFILHLKPRQD